jgi:tRNA (cmo5U34)-methyltransferase
VLHNLTKVVFDTTASTYDSDRSKLVPGSDTFYRWAIDLVPTAAKTIVELGCGSGLFTVLIQDRFPTARVHAIDFSGPMLALARERLVSLFGPLENITLDHADYTTSPIPQGCDAIVSSLSIHHLDDPDKQSLFRKIHAALAPGGVFINADHIAAPTAALEARYQSLWLAQVRSAGATGEQIAASLYRQQQDRRSPVDVQLAWMRDANFSDADCWYKENCFAVMSGSRAWSSQPSKLDGGPT